MPVDVTSSSGSRWPRGFAAHASRSGLRSDRNDLAIVVSAVPAVAVGLFTRSRFAGPSVILSQARLGGGKASGVVVLSGNANVATGTRGAADAEEIGTLAAHSAGVPPSAMLVASTGVIGRPYPMERLRDHFKAVSSAQFDATPEDVARAIMTTDTVPKTTVATAGASQVLGIAKGVGMIEPDMATMLAFVFTDAAIEGGELDRLWRGCVDDTFNCLSIDTDTSTSDTALVLANGVAGPVEPGELGDALRRVCLDLTLQLAADGEGATKLIVVTVRQARDRPQAKRVAKAIVNSPLVKAAVHGADPNWGRVAMAIGKCSEDTDIDPARVVIRFGDLEVYPSDAGPEGLKQLHELMSAPRVDIDVSLGTGAAGATVYGCDLSAGYVRINADYTT